MRKSGKIEIYLRFSGLPLEMIITDFPLTSLTECKNMLDMLMMVSGIENVANMQNLNRNFTIVSIESSLFLIIFTSRTQK